MKATLKRQLTKTTPYIFVLILPIGSGVLGSGRHSLLVLLYVAEKKRAMPDLIELSFQPALLQR